MIRVTIQDLIVKAFNNNQALGKTTMEKIQDYCKNNDILMPLVWNENDSNTIEIIENYFKENNNDAI